jgi:glutamine amidotransferase
MCRLMLYMGRSVLLTDLLVRPPNSLINQSVHCRSDETPVNGDGFGVAWYVPEITPEPGIFKSLTPAWSNNNLSRLAKVTRSHCILAHVRAASTGSPSTDSNCHPFTYKQYAFAHNGDIGGFRAIRRAIQAALSEEAYHITEGSTDSEHLFATFIDKILQQGNGTPQAMAAALEAAVRQVLQIAHKAGIQEHMYLNVAATDGRCGVGCRFSTDLPEHTPTLYTHRGGEYIIKDGSGLLYGEASRTEGCAAISSEPLSETHVFDLVPHNHLVIIDEERQITVRPMDGIR